MDFIGKNKKILILVLILVIGLIYFLTSRWGIRLWTKKFNVSSPLSAEVINWDPNEGIVSFRYSLKTSTHQSKFKIVPDETFVFITYLNELDCQTEVQRVLEGNSDKWWSDAFRIGDKITLSSSQVPLSKNVIPENIEVLKVVNDTPRKCLSEL